MYKHVDTLHATLGVFIKNDTISANVLQCKSFVTFLRVFIVREL